MGWLDYFRSSQKNTAAMAKERLQIVVAHERMQRNGPDYLPLLQKDILQVISKYVAIDPDDVRVNLEKDGDYSVLELNISLPQKGA